MLKTPQTHFDYMRKSVPEGFALHKMLMRDHAGITEPDLWNGRIMSSLAHLEGLTRHMSYAMLLYDRAGQNTYVLGPKVQDLFRRTELSRVTRDLVVPPALGIYVALPDSGLRIWGGARTGMHDLRGIYATFARSAYKNMPEVTYDGIHFLLWGPPNAGSFGPGDDAVLWFSMDLARSFGPGDDIESFFQRHAVMRANESNIAGLEWEGGDPFAPSYEPLIPTDSAELEEQRATLVASLRIVINLCLYVSSEEPDLETNDLGQEAQRVLTEASRKKSAGKRKKMERRASQMAKTRIVYVGPKFERQESSADGGRTHASPAAHTVRPHWQHYWTGAGDGRRRVLVYKGMYVRGSG